MLLIVAVMSVLYVRRMVRGEPGERRHDVAARRAARRRRSAPHRGARGRRNRRQWAWNAVGIVVFVVMVFPVYWMIATAFKPDDEIIGLTPTWFPVHPTLSHFRDAMDRPFFWNGVKNSLIIVAVTVAVSMVLAFLAAVALAKFRFTGRQALHRPDHRDPDAPAGRADHPALRRAGPLPPGERAERRDPHLHDLRAAVLRVDAARLHARDPARPRGGGDGRRLEPPRRVHRASCLPLVAPGLVATSVFAFITCWNEYIFARVLLNDQSKQTATVWLSYFTGTSRNTDWGALMAGVDADRRSRSSSSSCSSSARSRSG